MEFKSFRLEVKDVADDGTFEGYAAVFGNVDRVNDVIEPGAFKKTIAERPEVPIFWMHDPSETIGVGMLTETKSGLRVQGKLTLAVRRAAEAHALMLDGAVTDLSIGYKAVKKQWQNGTRRLKEVKVGEFSVLPAGFGANELALISAVKSASARGIPADRLLDMLGHKAVGDAATIAWEDEDGFQDLRNDISSLLPGGCYVIDIALDLSAALVCNYLDDEDAWVVPFTVDDMNEPSLSPQTEWVAADRSWTFGASDEADEGALDEIQGKGFAHAAALMARAHEIKEGRVLSSANRNLLTQAKEAIQALLDASEPSAKGTRGMGAALEDGEPSDLVTRRKTAEDLRAMKALVRG